MVTEHIEEFFTESNKIENVHGEDALTQTLTAWEHITKQNELTHDVIKSTHGKILENRQPEIAGEYRSVNVIVGEDKPPAPPAVPTLMEELLEHTPTTATQAIQWHVYFEKIHPFTDGNGRIGRMIYAWHCNKLNIKPVLWRAADRHQYYTLFSSEPTPTTERIQHTFTAPPSEN